MSTPEDRAQKGETGGRLVKVAIVHYWLVGMRGGERVLEALCALYPEAIIITHVADRAKLSKAILRHEIRETFIARMPGRRSIIRSISHLCRARSR